MSVNEFFHFPRSDGVRIPALLVFLLLLAGCTPDRALLMETKFDAPLRQKMALIPEGESENIAIIGKCNETIDAAMRQAMMDAGADVQTMNNEFFTATVSSDDIFDVAVLDFITQIDLSQTSKLLPR